MPASSKQGKTAGLLFILRSLGLLFLYVHSGLYFSESLSLLFSLLSFAAALLAAWLLHKSRLRIPLLLPLSLIAVLALRFGVLAVLGLLPHERTSFAMDLLALGFERGFQLLFLPFLLVIILTLLFFRLEKFRRTEPVIHGLLLLLVFWSQADFRLTLYPHPLLYGLAVAAFLLLELSAFIVSEPVSEDILRRFRGMIVLLVPLAVLLGFVFSRYSEEAVAARGGLMKPSLFRFDFSNYLSLESEIRQSRDLVLLYRRSEPLDRRLLRRYVLDGYKDSSLFFRDPNGPAGILQEAVPSKALQLPVRETEGRKLVSQEIFLVNLDPDALVSLDYPVEIRPLMNWKDSSFSRVYEVTALAFDLLPFELSDAADSGMSGELLSYYTRYGGDTKIQSLAEEITEGLEGYYDKVQTIHDYLKYEYTYSLKPGIAADGNQLHHFLFSGKKGYCSYFAFSMALLCRSLGIPARVAVGFFIDPGYDLLGYYPVRSDMAHAWVEVYFDKIGWVDFDPTSETLTPGEEMNADPGFDKEKLSHLLDEIISNRGLMQSAMDGPAPGLSDSAEKTAFFTELLAQAASILKAAAPFLIVFGIIAYRFRFYVLFLHERTQRKKTLFLYSALLLDLSAAGYCMKKNESPAEAAARFEKKTALPLSALFSLVQKAKFSNRFDGADFQEFQTGLKEFRRFRRKHTGFPLLLLLTFHPRSFRRTP